jgi:hypothetical protein
MNLLNRFAVMTCHKMTIIPTIHITIILIITLLLVGACNTQPQQHPENAALPTLASLPTLTNTATALPPSPTYTPTITPSATITETHTSAPSVTASATYTLTPIPTQPPRNVTPLPSAFTFGKSAEGRDLLAYAFGRGQHILMLVGGVHTGFEANTVDLLQRLREHYQRVPADVQADVQIVLIPVLNPDGLQWGRQLRGRFNAREVDLNRNWGCDWSEDAVFRDMAVSAGTAPFSEPETQALASLIQEVQPSAVLFYHGAANGVFAGRCEGNYSDDLARVYGDASGYPYGDAFNGYRITGSAPAWVNSLGIPSADVELATADGTEFMRNLRAINSVQVWLSTRDMMPNLR